MAVGELHWWPFLNGVPCLKKAVAENGPSPGLATTGRLFPAVRASRWLWLELGHAVPPSEKESREQRDTPDFLSGRVPAKRQRAVRAVLGRRGRVQGVAPAMHTSRPARVRRRQAQLPGPLLSFPFSSQFE